MWEADLPVRLCAVSSQPHEAFVLMSCGRGTVHRTDLSFLCRCVCFIGISNLVIIYMFIIVFYNFLKMVVLPFFKNTDFKRSFLVFFSPPHTFFLTESTWNP